MHKKLVCELQFISTAKIIGNLYFELIFVSLFQDVVFDDTEGLLLVQARGSTQNHNSTGH